MDRDRRGDHLLHCYVVDGVVDRSAGSGNAALTRSTRISPWHGSGLQKHPMPLSP